MTSRLYRAAVALAVPLVPTVLRSPRQRAAHFARLATVPQLQQWAAEHRNRHRPLAWFHASSVGEGLQARAVIEALRAIRADAQVVYTHFSPSAAHFADTIGADWAGYLPYDRHADVTAALSAVEPDVLVFTKLDLWPELSVNAAARGTAVAIVAGTVSPESGRLRFPARLLAGPGYRAVVRAGAISKDDATRLVRLGCRPEAVSVTGDPRADAVLDMTERPASEALPVSWDRSVALIAGSTWPADEEILLEAFVRVRREVPRAVLVVVPHEPSPQHLAGLVARAERLGLPAPATVGAAASGDATFLVVDRVGILSRLYPAGTFAYVGGGWGRSGIHSVLEPAAWARPVIIGPHDRGSRDAELLAAAGGLTRLPRRGAVNALSGLWTSWLRDPGTAAVAGAAARQALEPDRGAAARNAAMVAPLLDRRSSAGGRGPASAAPAPRTQRE